MMSVASVKHKLNLFRIACHNENNFKGNSTPTCNIAVIGAQNVGKTALIVRYLTKRYLPEYSHLRIAKYERDVVVGGKKIRVKITDTSGKDSYTSLKSIGVFDENDAFIFVYSITDKRSFIKAKEMLKLLNLDLKMEAERASNESGNDNKCQPTVALVANKSDLTHFRSISSNEGQRVALSFPQTTFYECSTANDYKFVEFILTDLCCKVLSKKSIKRSLSCALSALTSVITPSQNKARTSRNSFWWKNKTKADMNCIETFERSERTLTM